MADFTIKDLIISYNKSIISKNQFIDHLINYVKAIYREVYNNPNLINVKNNLTNVDINSIVERICIASFEHPNGFFVANEKNNEFNEIQNINNSYEVFHAMETKVILGTVPNTFNKKITLSLGLETGTIFVNIIGKKKDRLNNDEPIVATYALADKSSVVQFEKRGSNYFDYDLTKNRIDNSVVVTRFDPSNMETYSYAGRGKKEEVHRNKYEKIPEIKGEELELYKKYFKEYAPCPHFHYYQVDVNYNLGTNKYSFAINIHNLKTYLDDLEVAKKKVDAIPKTEGYEYTPEDIEAINNPILEYDLGMPYLLIAENEIVCDVSDFFTKAKAILKKYTDGAEKEVGMNMLYDMIEKTRRKDSIGALASASDILCFAASVVQSKELVMSGGGGEDEELSDEQNEDLANLGTAFINASGLSVKAKNLNLDIKRNSEPGDDN